jgi:hypothetical protein
MNANTKNNKKGSTSKVNMAQKTKEMRKEEIKQIDAALCEAFTKSINRMDELEHYYKAFNMFSVEKLEQFEEQGKQQGKLKNPSVFKFVSNHLQIYFAVYAALTDEFKYRVLYDESNPNKHFYRHYHKDVETNYEYLNCYFLNQKVKVGQNTELKMCIADSKQKILFECSSAIYNLF